MAEEKKEIMNFLAHVQENLKAPKTQFNKFGNYAYRSCSDILEALKPIITPHGYYVVIYDEIIEKGNRIYVKATATLSNGEISYSSMAFAREEESAKGMSASQITGAASSYARKYALNGLFAIDDTKDADATNDHGKAEETQVEDDKPWFSDENLKAAVETIKGGNFEAWGSREKMMESIFAKYKVNKKHREILNNAK